MWTHAPSCPRFLGPTGGQSVKQQETNSESSGQTADRDIRTPCAFGLERQVSEQPQHRAGARAKIPQGVVAKSLSNAKELLAETMRHVDGKPSSYREWIRRCKPAITAAVKAGVSWEDIASRLEEALTKEGVENASIRPTTLRTYFYETPTRQRGRTSATPEQSTDREDAAPESSRKGHTGQAAVQMADDL